MSTYLWIVNDYNRAVRHDITPVIGDFNPTVLCYMNGMEELDISFCCGITPQLLVDCLPFSKNLKFLLMKQCDQFHEAHMFKIASNIPYLYYIDISGSVELTFAAAHYIIGSLKELTYFAFDPKYPERRNEWKQLKNTFRARNLEYGGKVQSTDRGN